MTAIENIGVGTEAIVVLALDIKRVEKIVQKIVKKRRRKNIRNADIALLRNHIHDNPCESIIYNYKQKNIQWIDAIPLLRIIERFKEGLSHWIWGIYF